MSWVYVHVGPVACRIRENLCISLHRDRYINEWMNIGMPLVCVHSISLGLDSDLISSVPVMPCHANLYFAKIWVALVHQPLKTLEYSELPITEWNYLETKYMRTPIALVCRHSTYWYIHSGYGFLNVTIDWPAISTTFFGLGSEFQSWFEITWGENM